MYCNASSCILMYSTCISVYPTALPDHISPGIRRVGSLSGVYLECIWNVFGVYLSIQLVSEFWAQVDCIWLY